MSTSLFAFVVEPYDTGTETNAIVRLTHNGQVGRVSYAAGWMDFYLYPPSWSDRCGRSASKNDWEKAYPKLERYRMKHVNCDTSPDDNSACRTLITGLLAQWIKTSFANGPEQETQRE